jgi:hypothetical protein
MVFMKIFVSSNCIGLCEVVGGHVFEIGNRRGKGKGDGENKGGGPWQPRRRPPSAGTTPVLSSCPRRGQRSMAGVFKATVSFILQLQCIFTIGYVLF